MRGRLSDAVLAAAVQRAAQAGVDADQALIATGQIEEEAYVQALAAWLGMAFEPLDHRLRKECPLTDARLVDAGRTGLLPVRVGGAQTAPDGEDPSGVAIVVVPAIAGSRALAASAPDSDLRHRVRLTTTARLHRFVTSRGAAQIGRAAADELLVSRPDLSAASTFKGTVRAASAITVTASALLVAPGAAWMATEIALAIVFLSWTVLRIASMLVPPRNPAPARYRRDRDLPIYTIIVALYREATAVPGLVTALEALDYPREKLDIKLVLETQDDATIDAVRALRRRLPCEIVIAPQAGPQTKPKALNAALMFARGSFVAVFDAEDQPEPDQLRQALDAFAAGDARLACVQARLTIDNTDNSWLTRGIRQQTHLAGGARNFVNCRQDNLW